MSKYRILYIPDAEYINNEQIYNTIEEANSYFIETSGWYYSTGYGSFKMSENRTSFEIVEVQDE